MQVRCAIASRERQRGAGFTACLGKRRAWICHRSGHRSAAKHRMVGLRHAAVGHGSIGLSMRIRLLGTGTPTPSLKRMSSGYLIEVGFRKALFDFGPGAYHRLLELGARPTEIT